MFFRKNNIILIDYIEQHKESEQGKLLEFSTNGIVVITDNYDKPTFIPMTSISCIRLVEGTISDIPKTQF